MADFGAELTALGPVTRDHVIVVRASRSGPEFAQALHAAVVERFGSDAPLVILLSDVVDSVEVLDETSMAAAGWVRKRETARPRRKPRTG